MLYIFAKIPSYFCKNIYWSISTVTCKSMPERGRKHMIVYTTFLRSVFEKFIGSSSLTVLEYQLSKRYPGINPYELLLDSPQKFYKALIPILGTKGSLLFLKLIFKHILERYELVELSPDELVKALLQGKEEAKNTLIRLLEKLPSLENKLSAGV